MLILFNLFYGIKYSINYTMCQIWLKLKQKSLEKSRHKKFIQRKIKNQNIVFLPAIEP